ncbi:similar to Saccharomyces cerevisiae YPR155C NCA2 Protein involved in regulation of mitochondrial expression of subunits 6 (Atp6p) and 8 (Atp8p) of the Fo-F1 ATP synthase [Maudiozyma barnettii]|uniref:Similar to Saccharomyces cerevisiae YPR155C NCA2 Protein involved in regulation of mitochondrial expression of subunits 6 (Atp6p) and 8 (Atp8p) of the Fo-F1 ATP synthase n=1 Tax=Maudiozyma barnettii TaxID=61262 RepID=A0A8H2ZF08_9SACH|nr:Nca2p [Kazachstania barnettii]CAB4251854.1 similar to Saccharomyces cerevisiae YPR155C NCA2 Protein involved in regulation of mitochondrial expression of subunits 6 (Atp6p) and 8 (Atp8p) of the Fo-F1 ATP synthase [Kazachstania barnettii]CAD1778129.1 similar to Saccharomyces cerevisiae YPR155C NCA2 Protein involved in regulation of mitochondrial expression of subunits 6 (Atp6p) and 8 (Atp8p) of the Fo-F1 ATP synthase [Kazachstania barnettii]
MILDHSIFQLIQVVNRDLELFTQRIALGTNEVSLNNININRDNNTEQYRQIENLQHVLQQLKSLVDGFQRNISNEPNGSNNNQIQKIDFDNIRKITKQLSLTTNFKENINNFDPNIVTGTASQIGVAEVDQFIKYTISRYVLILCYYSVTAETLVRLPKAMETETYFKSIENSFINKVFYLLQTSVSKSVKLFELIQKKLNHFFEISTTKKLYQNGFSHLSFKQIPEFTNKFCSKELLPTLYKISKVQNFDFVGIPSSRTNIPNPVKFIFGLPGYLLNNELQTKTQLIINMNQNAMAKFGILVQSFPKEFNSNNLIKCFDILETFLKEFNIKDKSFRDVEVSPFEVIDSTQYFVKESNYIQMISSTKPSFISRYWPIGMFIILNGPSSVKFAWESRFKMIDFFQKNVVQFVKGLFYNWIWVPIKDIWATVRHDEGSEIAMMSNGTLDSETNSLCRMVIQIMKDNNPSYVENIGENILVNQIMHGNLDEFMKIYENELNSPIKNIFTGKLIRSLLVQVQKTKVDGSLALNGIDKMLKSQQLVFGIMALSPAMFVIYLAINNLVKLVKLGNVFSNMKHYKDSVSHSLNNIERLLNYQDFEIEDENLKYVNHALLIMEISNLSSNGSVIVPKARKYDWNRDIGELINIKFSNDAKLNVVNRIYHTYSRYFLN